MRGRSELCVVFCLAFLLSLHLNSLRVACSDSNELIHSCGSTDDGRDADGRNWRYDAKYVMSPDSRMVKASYQDPFLPSWFPYMSARVFTSEASYKLPVKTGKRNWLRQHFYPSNYESLDPADACFSVVAGGATLLKNCSACV